MTSGGEEEPSELRSEATFLNRESFNSQYEVLKTIGRGGYAKVKLAYHRLTGTPVAVKVLHKKKQWCYPITSEVDIMMMVNHPNIISLLQVIESEKTIYLIMELAEGQHLYQYVQEAGYLKEDEARGIFRQILSAVSYCHHLGVIHRDLKPHNIMLDKNGKVKIIDFGLGTQVKPGQKLRYRCGTYKFAAPELFIGRAYDGSKIEIWTLGVVLYFMVVGMVPFGAVNISELKNQVVAGKYTVPSGLSEELRDLLSILMTVDPSLRPTVDEVMTHPWLKKDMEAATNHYEEMVPSLPDPAIVQAMEYIGFQAKNIKNSLRQRKFNQIMATYCLLQRQALQGHSSTNSAGPVNPGVTPFPSFDDPIALPLSPRRRGSEPALGTLLRGSSIEHQMSAYGQQAGQRGDRRATELGLPLLSTPQWTATSDLAHYRARSAPCIYFKSEKTEDNLCSHSASAEDKSIHSRGQQRGWRGWSRRIGNALRKLCCCCFPTRKTPRWGQNRESPQK